MIIKGLIDEDFVQYKEPSMTLYFPYCSFKCEKECGMSICHNKELAEASKINISVVNLVARYLNNPISKCVVFSGLEPFDSFSDMCDFLYELRIKNCCEDTVIIYTGYTEEEFNSNRDWQWLRTYSNIIIKFGRFIPAQKHHIDPILGVELASPNQYAVHLKCSKDYDANYIMIEQE